MIAKYIASFKTIVVDLLDTTKILNGFIFIFIFLILQIFTTNIDAYDCQFANMYFDNSYICVVFQFAEYFKGFLTAIDEKDITEIDELLLLLSVYFIGYIFDIISQAILDIFLKFKKSNVYIEKERYIQYKKDITVVLIVYFAVLLYLYINYEPKHLILWTIIILLKLFLLYSTVRKNKSINFGNKNTFNNKDSISDKKFQKLLNSNNRAIFESINSLVVTKNDFVKLCLEQPEIQNDDETTEMIELLSESEYTILKHILKNIND